MTGPWVKGKNYLMVGAVELDPFKSTLAGITPVNKTEGATPTINTVLDETTGAYDIITGTGVTRVRVDHVMDEATPRPYEVIHGQYTFQVQGYNLVTTDVGASVTLVNAMGATFP